MIVAPSVSIAISFFWSKAVSATHCHLQKRELRLLIRQSELTLKKALADRDTSDEHRRKLGQRLEELQLLLVDTDLDKIKSLRAYR